MANRLYLDGAHWRFALALYGQDGAADACLALQDRLGVDVNILLLAVYATAECGIAVAPQDVRSMDELVKAWRAETVAPLRAMRRRLKQPLGPGSEYAEVLRPTIKKAELLAEQIEQALLAQLLDRWAGERSSRRSDVAGVISTVVAYFAKQEGITFDAGAQDVKTLIGTLVSAARLVTPGASVSP